MYPYDPPYPFWTLWRCLGIYSKLFFLLLCVLGGYALFSWVLTIARVRAMRKVPREDIALRLQYLATLRRRLSRVRQITGAAFYLFGALLFLEFQWAYRIIDSSKAPIGYLILENFVEVFAFAANVFIVFLIVHVAQWSASEQIESCKKQLEAQS